MLRAATVVLSGDVDDARVVDRVALDADERNRRRVVLIGEGGTTFLLDLPQATVLRDGDGLVLDEEYTIAREKAAAETGLRAATFPKTCPYTIDQVLDPDFLP